MLKITPDKLIHNRYGNPNDSVEIDESELPRYLACEIEIEEGVTFERIFKLILLHKDLFNIIFDVGYLYGHSIESFEEQFNMEDKKEEDCEGCAKIEYLEVSRIFEHNIHNNNDEDWEYYLNFSGYGEWGDKDKDGNPIYGGISISLSPINQLKNYPIKFDNKVDVNLCDFRKKNLKFNKKEFSTEIPITLFDFIGAILYEITWHGTPESKDDLKNELDETVKRIDSGEEELYEMKEDEDGEFYFEDKDGNKKYLNDKDD